MEKIFRIDCDDHPDNVVDNISKILEEFGITITELDGGDGFNEYRISNNKSIYSLILDKIKYFKDNNFYETLSGAMALNSNNKCDCCGITGDNLFILETNKNNRLETIGLCPYCHKLFYKTCYE